MYVQGLVIAVPETNKDAYLVLAEKSAKIFEDLGVVQIIECWEDDVPDGKVTDFRKATNAQEGERIVFSWMVWPDKATCEAAKAKMQSDPSLTEGIGDMPFDGMRMIWGGFDPVYTFNKNRPKPAL